MGKEKKANEKFSLWKVDKFKAAPAVAVPLYKSPTRKTISLNGKWQVMMDPKEEGFEKGWFDKPELRFPSELNVPGNWNAQGLGGAGIVREKVRDSGGSMRSAKVKGSYVGLAWYRKSIVIPEKWSGKKIRLLFGGIMTSVRLWVNGNFVGGRWTDGNSFYFDVTGQIRPGQKNFFVMAIDNRWKNTATITHLNWYVAAGGPFRHIVLTALENVSIEKAIVQPHLKGPDGPGTAEVHITVINYSKEDREADITVEVSSLKNVKESFLVTKKLSLKGNKSKEIIIPVKIDPVSKWSWSAPNLYKLAVHIKGQGINDTIFNRFGMRTFESIKNRIELNKRPIFLRGQSFSFFWPNSFTPPITKKEYIKIFKLMKDYGFNYLRAGWLMPEECYQAADETGMMLQLELPYAFKPYDKIKHPLLKRLIKECLIAYGNHPSLVLLCMSNEGSWDGMGSLDKKFCDYAKNLDPTRLVMDTDGGSNPRLSDIVSLCTGVSIWADYMLDVAREFNLYETYERGDAGAEYTKTDVISKSNLYKKRPVIEHEFINVPSLFNPKVVKGFRDPVLVPPEKFAKLSKRIRKYGLEKTYPLYIKASHHNQANFIKEGMERSRKNSLKAGFTMCAWSDIEAGIHWGILDAFMKLKKITAEQMRIYNSKSVLLMDFIEPVSGKIQIVPDYCWSYGEKIAIQPYVSHYDHYKVNKADLIWAVKTESGRILKKGKILKRLS
jgi:hypothetical protein